MGDCRGISFGRAIAVHRMNGVGQRRVMQCTRYVSALQRHGSTRDKARYAPVGDGGELPGFDQTRGHRRRATRSFWDRHRGIGIVRAGGQDLWRTIRRGMTDVSTSIIHNLPGDTTATVSASVAQAWRRPSRSTGCRRAGGPTVDDQKSTFDLRREGDSNPRALWAKAFQEPRIRPLCHPSRCHQGSATHPQRSYGRSPDQMSAI